MKLLVVNIPTGDENSPFGDWARNRYVPLLKRDMDLVRSPDTELTFRFGDKGQDIIQIGFFRYLDDLASEMVFMAAQDAEEEGYDAVLIDCFGDPKLYELRQALSIPVIGIGEASMYMASMMCRNFGIVHISPYNIPEQWARIERYGLASRCVAQTAIKGWAEGDDGDLDDATPKIEKFLASARELIAQGCELIIPACSVTSTMLRFCPGAEDKYPNGITEVDGVPVLDVVSTALTVAQGMAALRDGGSAWISRVAQYAQPDEEIKKLARRFTQNTKYTYWDVV